MNMMITYSKMMLWRINIVAQILIQVCDIEMNWLKYLVNCFNALFLLRFWWQGLQDVGRQHA